MITEQSEKVESCLLLVSWTEEVSSEPRIDPISSCCLTRIGTTDWAIPIAGETRRGTPPNGVSPRSLVGAPLCNNALRQNCCRRCVALRQITWRERLRYQAQQPEWRYFAQKHDCTDRSTALPALLGLSSIEVTSSKIVL